MARKLVIAERRFKSALQAYDAAYAAFKRAHGAMVKADKQREVSDILVELQGRRYDAVKDAAIENHRAVERILKLRRAEVPA